MVFQIEIEDVLRSSTLTRRDVGRWACVIRGCIQILPGVESREEAIESWRYITRP
jgi:hypothetical protein